MEIYNQIPILLGYENQEFVHKYKLVTDYLKSGEIWFSENGLKIEFYNNKYHFISEHILEKILKDNRDINIDNVLNDNSNKLNRIFNWKVTEAIVFEFEIYFISQMIDETIIGVTDGYGGSNGDLTDRCFKLTEDNLKISKEYKWVYDTISKEFQDSSIKDDYVFNFPDTHVLLVDMWCESLKNYNSNDQLYKFKDDIINAIIDEDVEKLLPNNEKMFRTMSVNIIPNGID